MTTFQGRTGVFLWAAGLASVYAAMSFLWRELERSGAVRQTRRIGRATMCRLDREKEVVERPIRLDMALARRSMERAVEGQKHAAPRPFAH